MPDKNFDPLETDEIPSLEMLETQEIESDWLRITDKKRKTDETPQIDLERMLIQQRADHRGTKRFRKPKTRKS